jgi:cyanophycinase-like exopeptidase
LASLRMRSSTRHFLRRKRNNRPHQPWSSIQPVCIFGVGIDESTVLAVEPDGRWRVNGERRGRLRRQAGERNAARRYARRIRALWCVRLTGSLILTRRLGSRRFRISVGPARAIAVPR